jgi:hypothetical protein
MLKRHTNLFIKLILFIILTLLFLFLLHKASHIEQPVQAKAANSILEEESMSCSEEIIESEDIYLEKIKKWEEEYYYATNVWKFLRERNFSQEVTCGIIGNMMVETSGGTLDLKPNIYSSSGNYYGLCQWSQKYYPGTKDLPFEYQLDYLLGTMPWEFNTFGWLYRKDFDFEEFLKITDPAEAALAFAKSYERCGPASYEMRQDAALKAYEYFDLERPI